MRDFPFFTAQSGIAGITLSQIPYTKKAYILLRETKAPEELLKHCADFCYAAGAEKIYISGHSACEKYPYSNQLILLQAEKNQIPETDAALFPVTEKTWNQWRDIYNQKSLQIPNAAWMSVYDRAQQLGAGDCYFVHRDHTLLGIGKASGGRIEFLASVQRGAGQAVLSALCNALSEAVVQVEAASQNEKAMLFYEKMGFLPVRVLSEWYEYRK